MSLFSFLLLLYSCYCHFLFTLIVWKYLFLCSTPPFFFILFLSQILSISVYVVIDQTPSQSSVFRIIAQRLEHHRWLFTCLISQPWLSAPRIKTNRTKIVFIREEAGKLLAWRTNAPNLIKCPAYFFLTYSLLFRQRTFQHLLYNQYISAVKH